VKIDRGTACHLLRDLKNDLSASFEVERLAEQRDLLELKRKQEVIIELLEMILRAEGVTP
jgi:hypothetical protein